MKRITATACIFGLICVLNQAIGAEGDRQADHEALRALRARVETAINEADLDQLRTCVTDDFTLIMPDQKALTNWTGVVAYWNDMFGSKDSPVTAMHSAFNASILTEFIDTDAGYCNGTNHDVYTLRNKRKIALESTWSAILVKTKGEWKIRAAHVGINFLDNPILDTAGMSWFTRMLAALRLRGLPGEVKE